MRQWMKGREAWIVPALVAAAIRLVHLAFLAINDPLFTKPVVDAWFHWDEARRILQDGWLLSGEGAFYKGPFYSYVLAVVRAVFGDPGGVVAGRVLNVVMGSAAVALLARLAGKWAGPRASWLAGIVAAVYGTSIYYDTTLLQPAITALLMLGTASVLDEAARSVAPDRWLAAAGVLLGLLTITRGEGLVALLMVTAWAAGKTFHADWQQLSRLRAMALVLVPGVLTIAPVTTRNAILEHDPVLISWNGGINLFMGNDAGFDQTSGQWHPDLAWMRLYYAPPLMGGTVRADHQRFFLHQTRLMFQAEPGAVIQRMCRKAALLLTDYEIPNNQRIDEARTYSPVLALLVWQGRWWGAPFGWAAPLIAVGLVFAWRRVPGGPLACCLLALSWAIVPVLFFNTARYRLPIVLLLLPVAAAGWVQWRRSRGLAAVVTGTIVVLVGSVTIPVDPRLPPSDALNLADVAEREGRPAEALKWREKAVSDEPHDPFAQIRLGDSLRLSNRCDEAMAHYEVVYEDRRLAADWRNAATRSIARCLALTGRFADAEIWFRRFIDANPDVPITDGRADFHLRGVPPLTACDGRLDLGTVLQARGKTDEAIAEWVKITTDCAESDALVHRAQERLQKVSGAATP